MYKIGQLDKERACWGIFDKWDNKEKANELKTRYLVGRSIGGEELEWIDDRLDEFVGTSNLEALANASKDIESVRSLTRLLQIAKANPEYMRLLVYGGRASRLTDIQLHQVVDFFRTSKVEIDFKTIVSLLFIEKGYTCGVFPSG